MPWKTCSYNRININFRKCILVIMTRTHTTRLLNALEITSTKERIRISQIRLLLRQVYFKRDTLNKLPSPIREVANEI
jgi:hypothetical protein